MGIWKQRIDESWLKCSGNSSFRVINALGGSGDTSVKATAISLKHIKIDSAVGIIQRVLPTSLIPLPEKCWAGTAENCSV